MNQQLSNKLKNRHISMIALGGVIGTGLFFGAAKSIQATGPSIILAYILGGVIIYIIMRALGEMTVFSPSSGSFSDYSHEYLGPYIGFIAGWTAWFQYTIVSMVELSAVTFFLDFWFPLVPHWMTCLVLLLLFTGIQLLSVRVFGEFEFWFAGIKIFAIIMMLLFSVYLLTFNPIVHDTFLHNIASYQAWNVFFAHGFSGFLFSLVLVIFSFGGTEFVGIAAGEAQNPQKSIPIAINGVVLRIIVFYILTICAIICLYPFQQLNANLSPFVDVFAKIGITNTANLMNFVAITAALSAFNSCMYSASRMLFSLAKRKEAPVSLAKVTANKIPLRALLASALMIAISVVINYIFPEKAIFYLLMVATGSILFCWFIILITQIYFRRKNSLGLSYKLIAYPYSNIFAMCTLVLVLITMLWMDSLRLSVLVTPLWMVLLSIFYLIYKKHHNVHKS